jgi:hypothetical protein
LLTGLHLGECVPRRKREPGAGRPPIDDSAALEGVRSVRAAYPKWGYFRAALKYVEDSGAPEPPKHESVARRLADKLKTADGKPPKARSDERKLLWQLRGALILALVAVEQILRPGPEE